MRYSKEHVWVKEEGEIVTVGVSDYAQQQIKDAVFVQLPDVGTDVENGKSFTTIESVKSVIDIHAPVSGEVAEVNSKLSDAPELINKDPTGEGWLVKIKLKDKSELDSLMSEEDYQKFIQ